MRQVVKDRGYQPDSVPEIRPAQDPGFTRKPGLTVIILTYNSAETVGDCLEALAHQDYSGFHVVVVDDDSTDATLSIVSSYSSRLQLTITRNGSHIIPRGRNIGIVASQTDLVAFVDSDDAPTTDWTSTITEAFWSNPGTALLSGPLIPAYRTRTAQAIALNDYAIRRLFGGGAMRFRAGNCAINLSLIKTPLFDEEFRFAEDLELISRLSADYQWCYLPEMKVHHYSRETLRQYASQMYRYGFMKQMFSFTSRSYRWLDFVPLVVLVSSIAASLVFHAWWFLLAIFLMSFLEASFIVLYQRCSAKIALLSSSAWLVKNVFWSCGLGYGLVKLLIDRDTRHTLREKHAGKV
jgi:glycosyltransferase involved in cell wall biosynthesis